MRKFGRQSPWTSLRPETVRYGITSALASSLHGMGDCAHHQCVVISVH